MPGTQGSLLDGLTQGTVTGSIQNLRMAIPIPDTTLDAILALQLTVAWAGEGRCEPRRLGWWQTDLVDLAGGGDLLARLLPRTHTWASLEAVREAARRADAKARHLQSDPDTLRTIFFLGFDLDERVAERLAHHKRESAIPTEVLPLPMDLWGAFSRQGVEDALHEPDAEGSYQVVPGGRQMKGPAPAAPDRMVRNLAAALLPLADRYPLPFYRVKA